MREPGVARSEGAGEAAISRSVRIGMRAAVALASALLLGGAANADPPSTTPPFAGLSVRLELPPAERAWKAPPWDLRLFSFLAERALEVVVLDLRVVRTGGDDAGEPGCRGNLRTAEPGAVLMQFRNRYLVIDALDAGAPYAFCQPTRDGFRLFGFFFVEPPPELASLETWTLHPVAVAPDAATLSTRALKADRRKR